MPLSRRSLLIAAGGAVALLPPMSVAIARDHGVGSVDCPTRDCGYVYDPAIGDPEHGIAPGLAFDDLPDDWTCPNCDRAKQSW